jgi:hypothetical protein
MLNNGVPTILFMEPLMQAKAHSFSLTDSEGQGRPLSLRLWQKSDLEGHIALAVASSGIAAMLLDGGQRLIQGSKFLLSTATRLHRPIFSD